MIYNEDNPQNDLSIWILADSRIGNLNQAIALAEAIGLPYESKKIAYNCLGKLPNYLLALSTIYIKNESLKLLEIDKLYSSVSENEKVKQAGSEHSVDILREHTNSSKFCEANSQKQKSIPDIIISSGRRTAALASYLRKKSGNKTKIIQIMHPNLPFKEFELVILPKHDKANKDESNVIRITGALNNIQAKIATGGIELQKNYPNLKKFISVIIGGNSKNYKFTNEDALLLTSILNNIVKNKDYTLFISFSRRTPNYVKETIKNNIPSSKILIYDPTEMLTSVNQYFGMLAKADYIISTADSISMSSEAASTGKPLYIFCPDNFKSSKHLSFLQQLVKSGIARILNNSHLNLEDYTYTPLNEVARISDIVKSKIWTKS